MLKPITPLTRRILNAWKTSNTSEDGLTLVEGLVAILIVSAVTVSITPAIFLSVATRVQNRRSEQAVQLAHGQIDQIRVLVEQGINANNVDQLPQLASGTDARSVGPPNGVHGELQSTNYDCSEYDRNGAPQIDSTEALAVDVNGDCEEDFYVQTFRVNSIPINPNDSADDNDSIPLVFHMGVRVYYKNAELEGNLETEEASLVMTSGQGQQTTYPLATLYTVMAQGDTAISLDRYRCFIDGSNCD